MDRGEGVDVHPSLREEKLSGEGGRGAVKVGPYQTRVASGDGSGSYADSQGRRIRQVLKLQRLLLKTKAFD